MYCVYPFPFSCSNPLCVFAIGHGEIPTARVFQVTKPWSYYAPCANGLKAKDSNLNRVKVAPIFTVPTVIGGAW